MLPDWIELCRLLGEHRAEYVVVGGQAVIAHGYPRLTRDIDLLVRPTAVNGKRVLAALAAFGAGSEGLSATQFEDPRTLLVLGREPFRVDILTHIPGVTFDEAWASRIRVVIDDVELPVIGKAELIKNKRIVGRSQDLADVEELEKLDDT